ncbi:MAG: aminomethyl-transferring glycine dehydrogenase subunit GcvPA [Thermoprotei archaeon]|nr:MAG: aminomethyl-transferring glycine dehydrogenase subunit GcvPA [Thermoprotei archaeon]
MDAHPFIPNSSSKIRRKIMEKLGIESVEELFKDIPCNVRISADKWDELNIGLKKPLSEIEVKRIVNEKLAKNKQLRIPPFIGGGVAPHYVPAVVKYIISRGEFLTSYTPYQPEISQGILQALFEYQSLMAELLDMDIVNSSMYDGASALAEALLMSMRINKNKMKILLPANMNPFHKEVVMTYLYPHISQRRVIIENIKYDPVTGLVDEEDLKEKMSKDVVAVYLQNPNFFGLIEENAIDVSEIVHDHKALFIIGVDPLSLGLIKPPGELGADIAVGEGQPLGLGLCFGGPYLGIFAIRDDPKLLRQMPGRLIGLAQTIERGERAFAMILQTREQHIRRSKATSNICTNEALSAIASAIYLSLLGRRGLIKLSRHIYYKSHYAMKIMRKNGIKANIFKADFFKEFIVSFNEYNVPYQFIHEKLLEEGIHGGLYLGKLYPELGETALFAFTEVHQRQDIDLLVHLIKRILEKR